MNKQQIWNIGYFIAAFLLLVLFQNMWTTYQNVEPIPYSEFLKLSNEGQIVEVTVTNEQITGKLKQPINGRQYFVTNRVDPTLADELAKKGVTVSGTVQNTFL